MGRWKRSIWKRVDPWMDGSNVCEYMRYSSTLALQWTVTFGTRLQPLAPGTEPAAISGTVCLYLSWRHMQHVLCGTSRTSKGIKSCLAGLISQSVTSRLPPDQSHLFLLPSPHLLAAATQDPGGFTCAIGPPCHPGTCNQPLVHSFRHSQDSSALLPANINSRLILQRFRGKYEYIYH
ncbi:hypothetical protein CI102_5129 [Trichoderma harzianum]|nr:hypothetical protein CI102_5129 [Trichoderma harzianum]